MICPNCKNENHDGMKFCSHCGSPLDRGSNVAEKHENPPLRSGLDTILRIVFIASVAAAILFAMIRSQYIYDIKNMDEVCGGYCIRMRVNVESKLLGHSFYKYGYETFNLIPPCPSDGNNSKSSGFGKLLIQHKPATDENIDAFVNQTIKNYQYDAGAWMAVCAGIAALTYMVRYFLNKRRKRIIK